MDDAGKNIDVSRLRMSDAEKVALQKAFDSPMSDSACAMLNSLNEELKGLEDGISRLMRTTAKYEGEMRPDGDPMDDDECYHRRLMFRQLTAMSDYAEILRERSNLVVKMRR